MSMSPERLTRRDLLACLLLALLVILFFHQALILGEQFYAGDTYRYFYPLKKMVVDRVRAGVAPVWNPLVHSGMPLHAALQAGVFYPFSLLLYLLPFDLGFKWYVAVHVLVATLGTYFLLRRWRLEQLPSVLGGVTYAFSGYVISHIDGLNIFSSIALLPVVFLTFERALEKPGVVPIMVASICVAIQMLAGDPVSSYFTLLICAVYWMIWLADSAFRCRLNRETATTASVLPAVVVIAVLLSAVQIVPSQELTRCSTRAIAITYASATHHSLAPSRLLTLFVPYLFGNSLENVHDWGRIFSPHFPLLRAIYVGAASLVLAPLALVVFRERRVYFFAGVLIVSLVLSLGEYTPAYRVAYETLPLLAKFRYPTKIFFATTFSMAVLSGYGLQYLLTENTGETQRVRRWAASFFRRYSIVVVIAAAIWVVFALCDLFLFNLTDGILLSASSAEASLTSRFIPYMKHQALNASIMFVVLGACLVAWDRRVISRRLFGFLMMAYLIFDLIPMSYRAMATIPENFYDPPAIDAELRAEREPFRLYRTPLNLEQGIGGMSIETRREYYLWNRELLSPNFGTLFGYGYTDGYESANLLWHNMFIRMIESVPPLARPRLLGLVNVKYVFSSRQVNHPDLELKSAPAENVFLYENRRCLDRAYFVPAAVIAPTERDALSLLALDRFDPRNAVVLVERGGAGSIHPDTDVTHFEVPMPADYEFTSMNIPGLEISDRPPPVVTPPNSVEIQRYEPNVVALSVDAPSDGYVVLCDAYYPKWQAYVNGTKTNILRANSVVRAVPVQAGKSSIDFVYDTSSIRTWGIVSLITFIACFTIAGVCVFRRKKK